jgi:hypothetical protein
MIDLRLLRNLTPEDRAVRVKWARGVAIVYGTALLLVVGLISAQRMLAAPTAETAIATAPAKSAPPVGRN